MALWVIELNDANVRVSRDGELVDASPGIALLKPRTVVTGLEAAAEQHLNPRAVFNRFWQQLNETPLPGATRHCRHHADLAYHHLAAILARAGQPSEVIFAVPAHYGEHELSLLLGICAALKLRVAGLVDSAVAALAGSAGDGHYVVADLFQHHVTVVEVEVDGERGVRRGGVTTLDQPGLNRIHQACIDLIADAFLEQARFDPLHEASTEQLLYSNLPAWLREAGQRAELDIAIDYHGAHFAARIKARELERITAMVLAALRDHLGARPNTVLSAALAGLPGALTLLTPAAALEPDACARGIAEHRLALHSADGGVSFVTSLPATKKPALSAAAPVTRLEPRDASHILCGHHAVSLDQQTWYLVRDGAATRTAPSGAAARVTREDGHAVVHADRAEVSLNGARLERSARLRPGDHIVVDGGAVPFIAISVASSSAP